VYFFVAYFYFFANRMQRHQARWID